MCERGGQVEPKSVIIGRDDGGGGGRGVNIERIQQQFATTHKRWKNVWQNSDSVAKF